MSKYYADLTRQIRGYVKSCPTCGRMITLRDGSVRRRHGRFCFVVFGCPCGPQTHTWDLTAMTELSRPPGGPLLPDDRTQTLKEAVA